MSGKTSQLKNCISISVILLLTAATNTTARTIYVDDDNPADFNNIQAAINNTNDGDTIIVAGPSLSGTSFWSSLIDDVRIYNRAVSP